MDKKLYPFSSAQTLLYYGLKYSTKPSVSNICISIHFDGEIDPGLMLEAVRTGLGEMKSSKTRIVKNPDKKGAPMQYFSDEEPQGVEIVDFSEKGEEALEKYFKKLSTTGFPHRAIDTQLYKIKLIKKPDGHYCLYMCTCHIAFDAFALMTLVNNIVKIYVAMRDGMPVPENPTDPVAMFELDSKYQESERKKKDIEFWNSEIYGTEPLYSSVSGDRFRTKGKRWGKSLAIFHPGADRINLTLDKSIADGVNAFCAENRVSPICVYWLAVRGYLSKVCGGQEDISFFGTISKRWNAVMKKAGGTAAQALPLRLNIPNSTPFIDACRLTESQRMPYYKHANLSTLEMNEAFGKYGKPITYDYLTTTFTYQPYTLEKVDSVPLHIRLHSTGANPQHLYLMIMPVDHTGNLCCSYDYNTHFVKPEEISAMQEYLARFLDTCVKNPDMTLGELTGI